MVYVVAYVVSLSVFLAADAVWLGLIAYGFYAEQLGALMREDIVVAPALGFYAMYVVGVVALAIAPALAADRWQAAMWRGALLGFCAYGTYDFTNLATLKDWPVTVTVVDLAWGTAVTGAVATVGYAVTRKIMGNQAAG